MKRKDYKKPATVVVEVKQQHHLMNGSPDPQPKASEESLEDYFIKDSQTW